MHGEANFKFSISVVLKRARRVSRKVEKEISENYFENRQALVNAAGQEFLF